MENEQERCINCMQEFQQKPSGYLRYSLRSIFSWKSHSDTDCSMFVVDALSILLPDKTSIRKDQMTFICPSCRTLLKEAMIGRSAEKEFIRRSAKDDQIKVKVETELEIESESVDDALVHIKARPVLISSVPIRIPVKRRRVDHTYNKIDKSPEPSASMTSASATCASATCASASTGTTPIRPSRREAGAYWKGTAKAFLHKRHYSQLIKILHKNSPRSTKAMEMVFHNLIRKEVNDIQNYCKVLHSPVTEENLEKFDWDEVVEVLSKKMPYLFNAICVACSKKSMEDIIESKSEGSHSTRSAIGNVIATLLYLRESWKYKFVPGMNSLLIWRSCGSVNVKVTAWFHRLGIGLGVHASRRLVKRLTTGNVVSNNHGKEKVDEDSNKILPKDDASQAQDEQSCDQNSVEGNGDGADEQSDVSMSDNEEQQSDDEISHDSAE